MNRYIIAMIFFLVSSNSYAFKDFECTVKQVYKLTDSGLLEPGSGFVTPDINSTFIVNRQSGQITAKKIGNSMSGYMPKVHNAELSPDYPYRAITIYPPYYKSDVLEILHYKKGIPFMYKGAFHEVVTGTCKIN